MLVEPLKCELHPSPKYVPCTVWRYYPLCQFDLALCLQIACFLPWTSSVCPCATRPLPNTSATTRTVRGSSRTCSRRLSPPTRPRPIRCSCYGHCATPSSTASARICYVTHTTRSSRLWSTVATAATRMYTSRSARCC